MGKTTLTTFFVSVLFILSAMPAYALEEATVKSIIITIDSFGLIVGIVLLAFLYSVLKHFTGSLKKSFNFILYGISLQVFALLYTLIFIRFKLFQLPAGVDLHHFLMISGIIFFAFGAYKLKEVIDEVKK